MTLERNINHCENLGRFAGSTMNVVLHDAVVEDAVALVQRIDLFAVVYLHLDRKSVV